MNGIMYREAKYKFGGRCAYCGRSYAKTVDHVQPLCKGGLDWIDNLLPCCRDCNNCKADMSLEEFRRALWNARFNIMPHKKTAASNAGIMWKRSANKFEGERVEFYFERVNRQ